MMPSSVPESVSVDHRQLGLVGIVRRTPLLVADDGLAVERHLGAHGAVGRRPSGVDVEYRIERGLTYIPV